jgi:hypothetical protein
MMTLGFCLDYDAAWWRRPAEIVRILNSPAEIVRILNGESGGVARGLELVKVVYPS